MTDAPVAPAWRIDQWLNAKAPITLESLRGRVVFATAFQMLCPGCVSTGLPQAQRVREAFPESDLAVVGLHTVFEHHEAQGTAAALRAFLHEYRINFPVGIDAASPRGAIPQTMQLYQMQGTPTTIVIDRLGVLRVNMFGHVDDLRLGAALASLIGEEVASASGTDAAGGKPGCDDEGCRISR